MATITINIPVDKEDWVMDGLGVRFGYEDQIDDGSGGFMPNPETKPKFAKRMIQHMIKNEANMGHNQLSNTANADVANAVILT